MNCPDLTAQAFISQFPELKSFQSQIGIIKINKDGTAEIRDYNAR